MGKQSRRKVASKKETKDLQAERRQAALDEVAANHNGNQYYNDDRSGEEIMVGDRVWWRDEPGHEWQRAVVHKVVMDQHESGEQFTRAYLVQRLQDAGSSIHQMISVSSGYITDQATGRVLKGIKRDRKQWTPRWALGDRVVCYAKPRPDDSSKNLWVPALITKVWVTWTVDTEKVFGYTCGVNVPPSFSPQRYHICNASEVSIECDDEDYIREHPSSFRFEVGQAVFFSTANAVFLNDGNKPNSKVQPSMEGKVVKVDVYGLAETYGIYEVSFLGVRNRRATCYITRDIDEHVCSVVGTPRTRLLDAIDQRCNYKHIDHLVDNTELDVASFQDMLLARAIQSCSYDAIWWLQARTNIDLFRLLDAEGNGFLHQISMQPLAARFFERACVVEKESKGNVNEKLDFSPFPRRQDGGTHIGLKNHQGRSWLHGLVAAGNTRALSVVFSPRGGMAGQVAEMIRNNHADGMAQRTRTFDTATRDLKGVNLRDTARSLGRVEIEKMIDAFAAFYLLFDLHQRLDQACKNSDFNVEQDLSKFSGEEPALVARRLIRFSREVLENDEFAFTLPSIRSMMGEWIEDGLVSKVAWLVQADPSLLNLKTDRNVYTRINANEFAQPEMYDNSMAWKEISDDMGVVSLAAHAAGPSESVFLAEECEEYAVLLSEFINSGAFRQHDLASSIITAIDEHASSEYDLTKLEYKLSLFRDEESLEDRLQLIRFFVGDSMGLAPPNAVDVVRWRRCGVLRWLVAESFVDLLVPAISDIQIMDRLKYVTFIGNIEILSSMTVGEFLLFAAVELDDLQTVQWLVEDCGIRATVVRCNGWNVMHACAHYGRTEIALWFLSQDSLLPLLTEPCSRKPFDKLFAVHLAVQRGFTLLADLFIQVGCPAEDQNLKTVGWHARKSKQAYVRDWGKDKGKPLGLEKDIVKLYYLLENRSADNGENIKRHIAKSRCLDAETWLKCSYRANGPQGPLGKLYCDVLRRCCSGADADADADFIVWICRELSRFPTRNFEFSSEFSEFWGRPPYETESISTTAVAELVYRVDGALLARCLETSWAGSLSPLCHPVNPVLQKFEGEYISNPSVTVALARYRESLLDAHMLENFLSKTDGAICQALSKGETPSQVEEMLYIYKKVALDLSRRQELPLSCYYDNFVVSEDGVLNLDYRIITGVGYDESHKLRRQLLWRYKPIVDVSSAWVVLVVEGYEDLIRWSLARTIWHSETEIAATRVASYFGHEKVLEIFLRNSAFFSSSKVDRLFAAALGAAEAGRVSDLADLLDGLRNEGASCEQMLSALTDEVEDSDLLEGSDQISYQNTVLAGSMGGSAMSYCLSNAELAVPSERTPQFAILHWLAGNNMDLAVFARAASLFLNGGVYHVGPYCRIADVVIYMIEHLGLNVWMCRSELDRVGRAYISSLSDSIGEDDFENLNRVARRWFELVSNLGLDIQTVVTDRLYSERSKAALGEFVTSLNALKAKQLRQWAKFDALKNGGSLAEIQGAFENEDLELTSRDSEGFLATHLAAAHDRVDVLQWLVESKGASPDSVSGSGRTVMQVAKACNASSVLLWYSRRRSSDLIATFLSSHQRRRLAVGEKKKALGCIKKLQARYRGNTERRAHRDVLDSRLESSRRFLAIWYRPLSMLGSGSSVLGDTSWEAIKQGQHDVARGEDVLDDLDSGRVELSETDQKLKDATSEALGELASDEDSSTCSNRSEGAANQDSHGETVTELHGVDVAVSLPESRLEATSSRFDLVKLTKEVMKFLRVGDRKYRHFFVRRIQQLAAGDRSRILAKRLTGSNTIIYETYLEQKSGHRILWTESSDGSLLVWYVAKHKDVSRLMDLIDDAESRSSRQLTLASEVPEIDDCVDGRESESETATAELIMLDPFGNTPLKLYEVHREEIRRLDDTAWKPPLHLTSRERQVVETSGTVLVFGRSGTGKTVCISNRMDYDFHLAQSVESFSQLFVARSQRLCRYVAETVNAIGEAGTATRSRFSTFDKLVLSLERDLPSRGEDSNLFLPSRRVDYRRFKLDFYDKSCGLDSLVVWTGIRSFLKGSIEAVQKGEPLIEAEFKRFGSKRCGLDPEQRGTVYQIFERYEKNRKELGLWDDCDRVASTLRRMNSFRTTDEFGYREVCYSKIYVDEVQDYTQAEIALFFLLSGPNDLFLAGDPAQSVVEGVTFRFEEVRSVGYHLYRDDKSLCKPLQVNLNFRSHSGILDVAGAVLLRLFDVFPNSATKTKPDRGLFHGPRPAIFQNVQILRLKEAVSKLDGIVVLTHDENVSRWKRVLDYPLVYGIREAKGLEFETILIVDFFGSMSSSLQTRWRDLLLERDCSSFKEKCPEIEGQLKLLYTAVTRCIQRLFFAETTSCPAAAAFARWVTTKRGPTNQALAVKQNVDNVEKMVRTPDEWRSMGLDNAIMAESTDDPDETTKWLDRAVYCFVQIDDVALLGKARMHRLSACFRAKLEKLRHDGMADGTDQVEVDTANIVEGLITERLLLEIKRVCSDIRPFLSEDSRRLLEERLISRMSHMAKE